MARQCSIPSAAVRGAQLERVRVRTQIAGVVLRVKAARPTRVEPRVSSRLETQRHTAGSIETKGDKLNVGALGIASGPFRPILLTDPRP